MCRRQLHPSAPSTVNFDDTLKTTFAFRPMFVRSTRMISAEGSCSRKICLSPARPSTRRARSPQTVHPPKAKFVAICLTFEHSTRQRVHPAQPEFAFRLTFEHSTRTISAKGCLRPGQNSPHVCEHSGRTISAEGHALQALSAQAPAQERIDKEPRCVMHARTNV